MQLAVIEFARNVCGIKDANSTEFEPTTKNPVIDLMANQKSIINKGGTLRLGNYECEIEKGTLAYKDYKQTTILERHRHRYEFNNDYKEILEKHGMVFSGRNVASDLVKKRNAFLTKRLTSASKVVIKSKYWKSVSSLINLLISSSAPAFITGFSAVKIPRYF